MGGRVVRNLVRVKFDMGTSVCGVTFTLRVLFLGDNFSFTRKREYIGQYSGASRCVILEHLHLNKSR